MHVDAVRRQDNMKKTTLALGSLLALGLVANTFAETTNVYSRNAVGYVNVSIPGSGQFNLLTVSLQGVTSTGMTFHELFGTNQLTQSPLILLCDIVYLWDKTTQSYLQYAQKVDGQFYSTDNWFGSPTNPVVNPGTALWIQSAGGQSDKTLSMVGSVPSTNQFTLPVAGSGFSLMGNPYPVSTPLDSFINTSDGATGSPLTLFADRVYMWDVVLQEYVQLGLKPDNKWYYTDDWLGTAADYVIKPGEGFWYEAKNAFTVTETKPYSFP